MKLPVVMLAREGSKRLPGKNRLDWFGVPLWWRALNIASSCKSVWRKSVSVVTDMADPLEQARDDLARGLDGWNTYYKPMPDTHTSHEGVDWWRKQAGFEASYCLLIQCTSPFINAEDLDRLVEIAFADGLPTEIWALGDRGKPCGMGYVIPPGSTDTIARRFVKPNAPMIDIDTMADYEAALKLAKEMGYRP